MLSYYKIIHTTCHTQWGDVEKRIFNESVWMRKNRHKIIIAAPKNTTLFIKAKKHGFKVYEIEFKRFSMIKDYKLLKNIFINEKPDVVNAHGSRDAKLTLFAAKKVDIPLRILSRHISTNVKNSWFNRTLYKKLCHYIFTTADYTAKHLQKTFKLNSMQIFPIPDSIIIPDHLEEKNKARTALVNELNLDHHTRFIGFAGRVSKKKGVSNILRAFKIIKLKFPHYHIVIVGEGTEKYINFLKNLAQKLQIKDYVHFTGFKENVWPYYRAFECKILPSKDINGIPFEGIPQVLLEAMYSSCPIIASKNGGIADIIDHEKTGLLFNFKDPSDLAHQITHTLQNKDLTAKRIRTARDFVKKHHMIDVMGRNIVRIYSLHQVLRGKDMGHIKMYNGYDQ